MSDSEKLPTCIKKRSPDRCVFPFVTKHVAPRFSKPSVQPLDLCIQCSALEKGEQRSNIYHASCTRIEMIPLAGGQAGGGRRAGRQAGGQTSRVCLTIGFGCEQRGLVLTTHVGRHPSTSSQSDFRPRHFENVADPLCNTVCAKLQHVYACTCVFE